MAGKKAGAKGDASEDGESEDPEAAEAEDGDDKKAKKDKDKSDEPPSARAGYIGLGLVGSLVVGFDPLRDAFQGSGSYENAIFRFLACVAVCVVGAGTIGRLIDSSAPDPGAKNKAKEQDDNTKPSGADRADGVGELTEAGAGESTAAELPSGDNDKESISTGSANLDQNGRQENHQQPLTSSEETSR